MLKIVLVYYVIAIFYVIIYYFRKRKNWLTQLFILLLCPGIGIIVLFEMNREYKNKDSKMPEWLIKQRIEEDQDIVILKPEFHKETSVVPITDMLILNNHHLKRTAMLNLLKSDTIENVDILSNALLNEDSETAHYAASAIVEIKRKMLNSIHTLEKLSEIDRPELKTLISYANALRRYIYSNLLDDQSKKIYMYKYSFLLEKLIEHLPQQKSNYIEKINCDIQLNEFEKVENVCKMFIRYCGNEEEAYFMSMKYYYLLKDKENLRGVLNQLKSSSIKISPDGMKVLRFWLNGMKL
jgi:hypothetical protein